MEFILPKQTYYSKNYLLLIHLNNQNKTENITYSPKSLACFTPLLPDAILKSKVEMDKVVVRLLYGLLKLCGQLRPKTDNSRVSICQFP